MNQLDKPDKSVYALYKIISWVPGIINILFNLIVYALYLYGLINSKSIFQMTVILMLGAIYLRIVRGMPKS